MSRGLMQAVHVTLGRAALQASLQGQLKRAADRIVHDKRAAEAVRVNDEADDQRRQEGEGDVT